MLLIHVHDKPVAIFTKTDSQVQVQYLQACNKDDAINPSMPVREKEYVFDGIPPFLTSLMPDDTRRTEVTKALGIDFDDFQNLIKHTLGVYNIGHIKVTPALDGIQLGENAVDGLSVSSPVPPMLTATSVEILARPDVQELLPKEIQRKAGVSGIGGHFPKAFLNTPEGNFIVKNYSVDFTLCKKENVAAMESETLRAAKYAGLPAAKAKAYGHFLAVQRFDTAEPTKVHHLKDMTGVKNKYQGSYEGLRTIIEEHCGKAAGKEFTKQVIYALLVGDSDKHQENCAILEKGGKFELAPVYDSLPSKLVVAGNEDLGLTLGGRKTKIGWEQLTDFATGYLEPSELSTFMQRAIRGIEQLVLPVSGGLRKSLARHTFLYSHIAQGKSYGEASKSLAQTVSAKHEPEQEIEDTKLSDFEIDI